MTSEAPTGHPIGGPDGRLKIALILSLALNLFIVAGFVAGQVWHPFTPTPAQHFERSVIAKLALNDTQRHAFQEFRRTMAQSRHSLRDGNDPLTEQFWEEEAKAAPDQAHIAQLTAQVEDNRRQFAQAATKALTTFMAVLDPAQRTAFADLVKNREGHAGDRFRHTVIP